MKAALMYCDNNFKKALQTTHKNKAIYKAFNELEMEIKKLDYMVQLNLYSATTQLLDSLINEPNDSINSLDVFVLRCSFIVDDKHETIKKFGLGIAVIAIYLSVAMSGAAVGIGIGMLLSLWQSPLMFMTSLFAAETASIVVASSSVVAGLGAGLLSQYAFFKEPKIKESLDNCVEAIKKSHLSTTQSEESREDEHHSARIAVHKTAISSPKVH